MDSFSLDVNINYFIGRTRIFFWHLGQSDYAEM